jgi:hypothetical protein
VGETGGREGASYVVCLDCGKQFIYDLDAMRIGKAIDPSNDASVVPEKRPVPVKTKLKYAVWAGLPLVAAVSAMLRSSKHSTKPGRPRNAGATREPGAG